MLSLLIEKQKRCGLRFYKVDGLFVKLYVHTYIKQAHPRRANIGTDIIIQSNHHSFERFANLFGLRFNNAKK